MRDSIFLLAIFLLVSSARAFIVLPTPADQVPRLDGIQLDYKVAIGSTDSPFQMQDLQVKLSDKCLDASEASITCTGWHEASIEQQPYYIDMKGQQSVAIENACWQISWQRKTPHGFLIVRCDVPEAQQRSQQGATLEKGSIYLYHRVWSAESLEYERDRRKDIQAKASQHLEERENLVQKLQNKEDTNVLQKLNTYGKALKAGSEFRGSGLMGAKFVPLYDEQVLVLSKEMCIMSTRGRVFRRAEWQRDLTVRDEDLLFLGKEEGQKMKYLGESAVAFCKD